MRMRAVRLGASLALAAALAALALPAYGARAALETFAMLAPLGLVTTLAADLLAERRASLGGLRRQLSAVGLLVAAQIAAAVALFAGLMFVSAHDAFFLALVAAYACLTGLAAARLVSRRALADLEAVQAALADVGEGERELSISVSGRDELAGLAAAVEAMAAKVAASERARREVIAAVSHDLRTPLTAIQLISEGLEDGIFEPERIGEKLQLLSTHTRALAALISDLFELSSLEAGELRMSMEQVRMDELVRETVDAMRPQADATGVRVRSEVGGELRPARGNPEQLQRVLFNLLSNAIRHTPPDGSVVVRAAALPDAELVVEVIDTGEGIPRSERERVFEPFVQGSAARGSAGLGLAIARAIVEAHGGRIWLADAPAGTQVRFSLPAA